MRTTRERATTGPSILTAKKCLTMATFGKFFFVYNSNFEFQIYFKTKLFVVVKTDFHFYPVVTLTLRIIFSGEIFCAKKGLDENAASKNFKFTVNLHMKISVLFFGAGLSRKAKKRGRQEFSF